MNFENLGFSFETSGFEVNPTFLSGSEAQGTLCTWNKQTMLKTYTDTVLYPCQTNLRLNIQ